MTNGNDVLHASSISPQVLISQQLGTADAAVYTVPAATSVKIAQGSLCNVTAATVTVNLSIVKSGGTVGDGTHRVITNYALAGYDTLPLRDYIGSAMLGPGDVLAAFAGTASAVDLVVTGSVHA